MESVRIGSEVRNSEIRINHILERKFTLIV